MNDNPHNWQNEEPRRERINQQQAERPAPNWNQFQTPPNQYPMAWQNQGAITQDIRQLAMIMHLLQFIGIPGLIAAIILWQQKKENAFIDEHGKMIVNWFISHLIYSIICVILCFVLIGIPLLLALVICIIVFPIIGAVKANNGENWKYPMTIKFIS